MSPQARRERAYRHYVAKQMRAHQKQLARAQKEANRRTKQKLKNIQPTDPEVTTSVGEVSSTNYPSVFDPVSQPQPSGPSTADAVVAPMTVSGSEPVVAQEPERP